MRAALRAAAPIALCMLAAAALSYARAAKLSSLRVDDLSLTLFDRLWPPLLFGTFAAVAGWRYLAALRPAPPPLGAVAGWRRLAGPHHAPPLTLALLAGAILIHLCAAPSLPLTSNDLFSNLAYGRLSALGWNPYLATPRALPVGDAFAALVGSRWANTPIVYGPILAAVNALAGAASGHGVVAALVLLKLLTFAATLGAIFLAYGFCRARLTDEPERAASSFVLFSWCPLLAWELSAQAHNDAFMVLAMVGFVWAATAEREWLAAVCLAAALYTKLAVAPIAVIYLVYVARRSPAKALALAVVVAALGAALLAPYWHGWETLRGPLATASADPSRTSRSFADLIYLSAGFLGPAGQKIAFQLCWAAGTLFLALLGVRALLRARTVAGVIHHGMLLLLGYDLLGAPWFQPWYVAWLLPLALAHPDPRWQRLIALYAVLTTAQYILPIDPLTTVAVNLIVIARAWPLLRSPEPR